MTDIEAQNSVNAGENLNAFGAGMDFFGGFGDFFSTPMPTQPEPATATQPEATVVNTPEPQQTVVVPKAPQVAIETTVEVSTADQLSVVDKTLASE